MDGGNQEQLDQRGLLEAIARVIGVDQVEEGGVKPGVNLNLIKGHNLGDPRDEALERPTVLPLQKPGQPLRHLVARCVELMRVAAVLELDYVGKLRVLAGHIFVGRIVGEGVDEVGEDVTLAL